MHRIYLDNNATTGLDPRVFDAMLPHLSKTPENPSSVHFFGQMAKKALSSARQSIAEVLQVAPQEILFTSSGTEAMNLLLRGIVLPDNKRHIISSSIEHPSVYNTLKDLEMQGIAVTYLSPGSSGAIEVEQLLQAVEPDTGCIVLSAANSETGVKAPLDEIAKIAAAKDIPLLIDAIAHLGKEPLLIPRGVSAMGFSGHKIHAPKGVGFAFVRSSISLRPQLTGGPQEMGRRGGTENLAAIVGLAKAVELLATELPAATPRMRALRNLLEKGILDTIDNVFVNGEGDRLANTSNISFVGRGGEDLLILLDQRGIAVSHGSACASGALEPSRALLNMGLSRERAKAALRFSLSRWTTPAEIEHVLLTLRHLCSKQ